VFRAGRKLFDKRRIVSNDKKNQET
jgi:hypothetical protein